MSMTIPLSLILHTLMASSPRVRRNYGETDEALRRHYQSIIEKGILELQRDSRFSSLPQPIQDLRARLELALTDDEFCRVYSHYVNNREWIDYKTVLINQVLCLSPEVKRIVITGLDLTQS